MIFLFLNCTYKPISDQELLKYATTPYDKETKMNTEETLGFHNGQKVKVIYPCGDLCPSYKKRIVFYELKIERCTSTIGVRKEINFFRGRAGKTETFCLPVIIADNWNQVIL